MKYFLLLVVLIVSFGSFGQGPRYIAWGKESLSKPNVSAVLPLDNRRYYVQYFGGTNIMPVSKIALYQDGEEVLSRKVDLQLGSILVTLEQFFVFQGSLYGCFSHKTNNNFQIFLQKYTLEADPVGKPILACEYGVPKGKNKDRIISVVKAAGENYLAVEYVVTGKQENYDLVGFTVFDRNLEKSYTDEIEIPYESNRTSIELRTLTENGLYFIGVHVFQKANRSIWQDFRTVEKTVLYQRQKDTLVTYELPVVDKRVFNFGLAANDSVVCITGTWGNESSEGAQGLFYGRISLKTNTLWKLRFELFRGDMLIRTQFDQDLNNVSNRAAQESLVNYAFKKLVLRDDGSLVVLTEQYYFYEYNSTDSRGLSNYISYYYFNDCLIYSISESGDILWFTRIPKQQESINDYGYLSSVVSFVDKGKMFLYFNDDSRNYNLMHEYKGYYNSFTPSVRNKYYCLAEAVVDLNNGVTQRHIMNEYDLIHGTVVTRMSQVDYKNRQVLFYVQGKREKYGYLRF